MKLLQGKIIPKFRRTHILNHAMFLVVSYILDPVLEGGLGCVRVGGRVIPENVRSMKVHEKSDMTREGTMRVSSPFFC